MEEVIYSYYVWIVVISSIFMFITAAGIGANDVANAFATSVGSKALSMKAAVAIAAVCELGGALVMGSHVTETIRKGIAKTECFEDTPAQLMYGCMWVLASVGAWLFLASKYEMPVSTTHSTVGGMIGMAIALGGPGCVNWIKMKDEFPYVGGVGGIVMSWFFSPILSCLLGMALYAITRLAVLRHSDSFKRALYAFPVIVGITVMINAFFIIYKGGKGIGTDDLPSWAVFTMSIGIGLVSGLIMIPVVPLLRDCVLKKYVTDSKTVDIELGATASGKENGDPLPDQQKSEKDADEDLGAITPKKETVEVEAIGDNEDNEASYEEDETKQTKATDFFGKMEDEVNDIQDDETVMNIHDAAEKFDPKTEEFFKYIQIFTAICDAWSHGANDVANAVGPFAAVLAIWLTGSVTKKNDLGLQIYWILALGGLGIVVGLLVYGHKIIKAIGTKLTKITPSRGFAIELGSAIVIIIGSRLGIPLSTTHCQVGATLGIGILECDVNNEAKKKEKNCLKSCKCLGINCKVLLKTFFGWIITLVVVGGSTALLTAQGVYGPCMNAMNSNFSTNVYALDAENVSRLVVGEFGHVSV